MAAYLDKTASLTPICRRVVDEKATEYPHTSGYNQVVGRGSYLCRRCGLALFRARAQFHSGCGWPSFDEDIVQAVKQEQDADGQRIEILCERCHAHLGHVFSGEHLTDKNLRHCVNGLALDYVTDNQVMDTEEALVAGGCFWGVDYYLRQLPGVLNVEVGYTGGISDNPTYEQVCQGNTGHYEAVRVVYDKSQTDYRAVIQRFFEIHDPTQRLGQGPDQGSQYQSAIFYYNDTQLITATELIQALEQRGYRVATQLRKVKVFWAAELYHQDYYTKHATLPYCHKPELRFD